MKIVLDASALILYFYGNEKVKEVISKSKEVYVNPVNLTEFLYSYTRVKGWKEALFKYTLVRNSFKVLDITDDIIRISAKLKVKYNLSLGDSFLVASAINVNGTAVTSDHELGNIKEAKVILIK
ncbi:type II toxin-antitoxin system VapC family toxin [Metallosphaera hakonensis]|uniref:PIN domain-containing protein n=1 Tax=Metallosphaera hakonensis JCM 8857 = DSM 7519 TaxID=1293036 RepID=A0A2U9IUW0_9CREN|nr:type II toxin-antitoxin system VapC family toxin [Metallosphaera hakonensis]AWR99880.1 PIN domain-containing protein [Metallosphaera hakonensis JCM 8857 = DSM 7519]